MKRPAVFFDRDNTLIANDGYLGDPSQTVLIPGAADAIARARALGYAVVTISNQSGVARGLFDEDAVRAVNARMDELLTAQNPAAKIDRHEFCPFHPEAVVDKFKFDSPLRKPRPGMLLAAAEAMALDLTQSWLIGDAPRDIAAGKAAGCRTILFHDPSLPASPAAEMNAANGRAAPDHTAATLTEAMAFIERQKPAPPPPPKPVIIKPTAPVTIKPAPLTAVLPPRKPPAAAEAVAPSVAAPTAAPSAPPKPPAKSAAPSASAPVTRPETLPAPSPRLETLAEQILIELRRGGEMTPDDFSVSKLLAGILQVIVLAILFLGYVQGRSDVAWLQVYVLVALTFQVMTIALLIMSRQK